MIDPAPGSFRRALVPTMLVLGWLLSSLAAGQPPANSEVDPDATDEGASEETNESTSEQTQSPPPRCALEVKLVAVVLEERKHERSFAMIAHKGQKPRMVGVGSWVGDRTVHAIEPRAIWLSDPAGLCWLPLERGGSARPATPPRETKANDRRKQREDRRKNKKN